jgi:hypothetical protein
MIFAVFVGGILAVLMGVGARLSRDLHRPTLRRVEVSQAVWVLFWR